MKCVLYGRYSSELQSPTSIADQHALCRRHAERQGYDVVGLYEDAAKSGASLRGRSGIAALMAAAKEKLFDVVLVESLDRLSRDQEDMASIHKRLSFWGIQIQTVHEGRADQIQVGVRGIVSALYLTDLANKTRRGQEGNVQAGKHAGGLAYGYRPIPNRAGVWTIHEPEAKVIQRIFAEYIAGASPRDIAHRLNADRIKAPRGEAWRGNTLIGSRQRQNGILANTIYTGRMVWNRVRMVKDPDTGTRISRPNPESEWVHKDVPELRIIDDKSFEAAQDIREARARLAPTYRRGPKHLLSGLLKCGCCGSGLAVHGKKERLRVYCTRHKESKSCENNRTVYLDVIEQKVFAGLRDHLLNPKAVEIFLQRYEKRRKELARESKSAQRDLEQKIRDISARIDRTLTVYIDGDDSIPAEAVRQRLGEMEKERKALREQLELTNQPVQTVAVHPAARARYLALIDRLAVQWGGTATPDTKLFTAVRDLIERISVTPGTSPGEPQIQVTGKLEALVSKGGLVVVQGGSGGGI